MEVIFLQGQLSQKERMLLEDLKKEEDLCVMKYQNYAQQAQDSQLSSLFSKLAGEEQKHHDTVDQLLQGGGPSQASLTAHAAGRIDSATQTMKSSKPNRTSGMTGLNASGSGGNPDQYLLQDMLSTEKYVSSAYDTGVFESAQPNIRKALQQIQQDEQGHGEQLYQYMSSHGMYQTQ